MLLMTTALCAASPFENAAKNIKNLCVADAVAERKNKECY